ncbi:MAG TPA: RDD family protein [Burkholderiales bacterium]|nr:RDD family protein [Burkholderiales bacterium]
MSGAQAPASRDAAPSILRRLASMLYESLLLFGVAFIGTWTFQFAAGTLVIEGWRMRLLQLFLLALFAAYFLWCWLRSGQTLAMKTWRIRLVAKDGHGRLAPGAALLRFIYAVLLVPTLAGIFWALVDRDRQFLHDRLAGSLLVPVP